jgi:uncharacterized RDD family membrane protein YckC
LPAFQSGAAALAVEVNPDLAATTTGLKPQGKPVDFRRARQQSLFEEASKVIAFPAPRARPRPAPPPSTGEALPPPRRALRRPRVDPDTQPMLDFSLPQPNTPRMLDTQVEASIYCDYRVASNTHRLCAAAVDACVLVFAAALFGAPFTLLGGVVAWNPVTIALAAGVVALLAIAYGIFWAIAGRETPGRRATGLRLVNFEGQPVEWPQRLGRVGALCISVFAAGAGLLWALVDEEQLTWQDHMSKSFPTAAE